MVEAELLFTELFNCDRLSLYLEKRPAITKDKLALISRVLERRIRGEPIQYILGKTEFMGLKFKVAPCVFIPRPETEVLVETVIRIVRPSLDFARDDSGNGELAEPFARSPVRPLEILEIGTGSGCIAISLAKYLYECDITATDISQEALNIARENAKINSVDSKIKFLKSNLFTQYTIPNTQYDMIMSNPPYITSVEIDNLQPEIQYEPRLALDGGKDGLEFYRKIISLSPYYLKNDGLLIMEMGFNQVEAIRNIFMVQESIKHFPIPLRKSPKVIAEGDFLEISGKFEILEVVKDYNNIDRVVVARKVSRNG